MKRHSSRLRGFLPMAILCVAGSHAGVATATVADTVPRIAWSPCPAGFVDPVWQPVWGQRLECGIMTAPLAYDDSAEGDIAVALIRIKAGEPSERQGALFFNFGGPGASPVNFLPDTAYLWSSASKDDPLDGDKRRLADRYDLVAVIPRGLAGGTWYGCQPVAPTGIDGNDLSIYRNNAAWRIFVDDAAARASACADRLMPYLGTLDHVHDMERARMALGETRMNFFGVSYGARVGALYAAAYPMRTGRMVLDSSMNFTATFEEQFDETPRERHEQFMLRALIPAVSDVRYGLGTDPDAVLRHFMRMPGKARQAWGPLISTPATLSAALVMASRAVSDDEVTVDFMRQHIDSRPFSIHTAVNRYIRTAAVSLIDALEADAPAEIIRRPVYYAVICGDTPWHRTLPALRERARGWATSFPTSTGESIDAGLVCHHWEPSSRRQPRLPGREDAPSFLMVHAAFDSATPLALARKAFVASPRASMVVADGMAGHGIFGASATPCVEHSVGHFLLTGELPAERETHCAYEPRKPQQHSGRADEPDLDERRKVLLQRLRHS